MKQILERPQRVFLFLAAVVLISGLLNKGKSLDINIYDTYLVFDIWSVCIYSMLFFLMIALNYAALSFAKKKSVRVLTLLHIALQIFVLIPFLYAFYTADAEKGHEEEAQMTAIFVLSSFVFLLATFLHFINFIVSLIRKKE